MPTPVPVPRGANGEPMGDERFKVALGCYDGITASNHFGSNPAVGTSFEIVQRQGGTHTFPTVAGNFDISSDNVNDASAGTGLQTVLVTGLDANYVELSEVVTMNGQTPVPTVAEFLTVSKLVALTTGSGKQNAGEVYATQDGGSFTAGVPDDLSLVDEQMPTGWSISEAALFTIPAGHTLYVHTINIFSAANKTVTFEGHVYNHTTETEYVVFEGVIQDSDFQLQRGSMPEISEKHSVWIEAKVDSQTAEVAASLDGWLIDTDKILDGKGIA